MIRHSPEYTVIQDLVIAIQRGETPDLTLATKLLHGTVPVGYYYAREKLDKAYGKLRVAEDKIAKRIRSTRAAKKAICSYALLQKAVTEAQDAATKTKRARLDDLDYRMRDNALTKTQFNRELREICN